MFNLDRLKKILVAGDIMLDSYCFGNIGRISPEAPVSVLLKRGENKNTPGGAANVAANIAAIGVRTDVFAVVGADENGVTLKDIMSQMNIGTDYIVTDNSRCTTTKLRYMAQNNQQILRVDSEDTKEIELDFIKGTIDKIKANISDYGLILISDYKKGFLSFELTQELIKIGKDNDIPVIIDVKDNDYNKYKGAYLLKPNKKELAGLSGRDIDSKETAIEASIKLCMDADCEYILTTLGAGGMILCDKDGLLSSVKTVAREVFDVTGAGDTSIAYLAYGLLDGKNVKEAMELSNYAASVQVSKVGTSTVTLDEVRQAMSKTDSLNDKCLSGYSMEALAPVYMDKKAGKKIVFTNGCFDILHAGHVTYLKKASELGDILVVGINSDASVKRLKGESRPVNTLEDRALVLSGLGFIDYVIPFEEDTPYELIKAVVPDILVKGGDYEIKDIVGKDVVEENGGKVMTIPLVEGRSTTNTINRMKES